MRRRSHWSRSLLVSTLGWLGPLGCGDVDEPADTDTATPSSDSGTMTSGPAPSTGATTTLPPPTTTGPEPMTGPDPDTSSGPGPMDTDTDTEGEDPGPMVDVSDPQLYDFEFSADEADPEATTHLATQLAHLDTQVPIRGRLVVFLHGAGTPSTCGSRAHGRMLAGRGFHVVSPCYASDYGVGNCGDDIGGCRLEAFEGVDHSPVIEITPPNSSERRVVRALQYLQAMHPGGDWQYYLDGELPRWDRIIITGSSHGASSSGVIGMHRLVDRVVMLSGPLDSGQAWLLGDPITPIERFWGFTHTGDGQHAGHLQAFEDLGLPGGPAVVDGAMPPYRGSHRLVTSAPTDNGHGSTTASGNSPMDGEDWVFQPVWDAMYVGD
ncbi:MAG: hypothetical protein AAGF11_52210 [Myxococcota bacterium]